jgi:uncharacterized MAPEG superfamily protein
MTTELTMLVYSTLLLIVLVAIQGTAGTRQFGFTDMAGNRDHIPPPSGFAGRAKRTVENHREGLTMFAPVVLAAAIAHISSQRTVIGAEMFFYSRLVHAACYLIGIPYVRTLAFVVGLVGTLMVLTATLGVR